MKVNMNPRDKKAIVSQLHGRFSFGEKMTIEDIILEFFNPKKRYDYLDAQDIVISIVKTVKRHFRVEGRWFGCIDDLNTFGLPTTKAEYRYAGVRYYNYEQGVNKRARELTREGVMKGLIEISSEEISISRVLPDVTSSSKSKKNET